MKTLIVLWDFPLCKKLESKLIFLVYSVILGQCFAFYLKQITKKESDRSIEKITKKQFICVFLILVLFLSFSSLIWLLDRIFFRGITTTIYVDYSDDCIFGADFPAEGLAIDVTVAGNYQWTVYTDANGIAKIFITEGGMFEWSYTWKGVRSLDYNVDELNNAEEYIELDCYSLQAFIYYDTLEQQVPEGSINLLYNDGTSWVVARSWDCDGGILYGGFVLGEYMFENQNDTFIIDGLTPDPYIFDAFITPILKKIKEIKAVLCLGREKQSFS